MRIPCEGILLEGYYLNVSGEAAGRYGWNCLIFEGPGQGAALRVDHLPF